MAIAQLTLWPLFVTFAFAVATCLTCLSCNSGSFPALGAFARLDRVSKGGHDGSPWPLCVDLSRG